MKMTIMFLCMASLALSALDLTTVNGKVYKNVTILGITPVELDILYYRDNVAVMRGIKFTELPPRIQQQYGYSPERATAYAGQIDNMIHRNFAAHLAAQRAAKMNAVMENAMMYYRLRATVQVQQPMPTGAVCLIDFASNAAAERLVGQTIFLFGCTGELDDEYTCLLYPTGMHINISGYGALPVYAINYATAREITNFGLTTSQRFQAQLSQAKTTFVPVSAPAYGGIYYQDPNFWSHGAGNFYAPNTPAVGNPPVWGVQ